jgi:methionine-gamma-lyase
MAALTAALLAAAQRGRHVVAMRPLYGGSDHLLASELLGLKVTWTTPRELESAIRDDTSLVIVETPANPTLDLFDIRQLVAKAREVPVLVDSTFATPVLQRPLAHGATLVLHSATKFLGGHGDIVGGVIATNEEWTRELRRVRVATGALLHPLAGYLLHRGLQTLPVRVRGAQSGAQFLADKLATHPKVSKVFYPGLQDCDPFGIVRRQMRGPGALLAFEVRGGLETADRVMQNVELITPAVSLGSVDTLIQHPAGLTHRVVDPQARASKGITDGLLRLSVGLESPDDLWHDLSKALDESSKSLRRRNRPLEQAASE